MFLWAIIGIHKVKQEITMSIIKLAGEMKSPESESLPISRNVMEMVFFIWKSSRSDTKPLPVCVHTEALQSFSRQAEHAHPYCLPCLWGLACGAEPLLSDAR